MMIDINNYWFVFIGENATTGTPNKLTGKMSMFGNICAFKTKAAAKEYAGNNYARIICTGKARKMRQFCLGMSVKAFEEHLRWAILDN